jgi:hypothetical protein
MQGIKNKLNFFSVLVYAGQQVGVKDSGSIDED